MNRRSVITLLGGAAVAWPRAARAEQPAMPVIGYLGANTPSAESQRIAAFVQRLRELGWIEGRTVAISGRSFRATFSQPTCCAVATISRSHAAVDFLRRRGSTISCV
jgi:putative ABC transport system substrate-binding protein